METYTAAERVTNQVRERALENTLDQRTEVKLLFAALRKATVGTEQYQSILAKIEAMQPGITKQYNLQAGAIQSINEAEKELTKSIMERAMMEARAEILKEKTKELLKAEQEGPTGWDKFKSAISHVGPMGKFGRSAEAFKNSRISEIQEEINILADQVAADQSKAAMSAKGQQAETSSIIQTNNANVNLNVNDPGGFIKTWESNSPFVNVNTSRSKKLP